MDRDSTRYELAHFVAVIAIAYVTLFAVRSVGTPPLWQELIAMLVVGAGYVAAVLALGLAPPSWRGNDRSQPKD